MPSDETAFDDLVMIGAAAAALGVSVDTLRRWERAGKVTFVRRDGRRYISAANLSALVRERNVRGLTSARNRLQGIIIAVKRDAVMAHPAPAHGGKPLKIYYCSQPATHPPLFVFHCNDPELVRTPYRRFLENIIRDHFDFEGVPLTLEFRERRREAREEA